MVSLKFWAGNFRGRRPGTSALRMLLRLTAVNSKEDLSHADYEWRPVSVKFVRVHMNVVPRSTGNTNSGTRELTLKCKFKCYINP